MPNKSTVRIANMDPSVGPSEALRTPTNRQEHRRAQYKSGSGSGGSTPEWRSKYRQVCTQQLLFCFAPVLILHCNGAPFCAAPTQRCKERLKLSRERLVSRFRRMGVDSEETPGGNTGAPSPGPGPGPHGCSSVGTQEGVDPVVVSVKEVMEEEWEIMRTENTRLPQLTPHRPGRKRAAPTSSSASSCSVLGSSSCKRPQHYAMLAEDDEYEVGILFIHHQKKKSNTCSPMKYFNGL